MFCVYMCYMCRDRTCSSVHRICSEYICVVVVYVEIEYVLPYIEHVLYTNIHTAGVR